MTPSYRNVHAKFKLNNIHYSYEDLKVFASNSLKEGQAYKEVMGNFLLAWLDDKDFIDVNTSGSTGTPRSIRIKKESMVNSAIATGDFLKLKSGDKAMHCLPMEYIAGKMMLIRAIILGFELDLVEPKSKPDFDTSKSYDFSAMVPLQFQNSLDNIKNIKTIIIGGSSVSNELKNKIKEITTSVYETYGMTETVTHIALKKLNNYEGEEEEESSFKTLSNIKISQDKRDCLVINAPNIANHKIRTNDIVLVHSETKFDWLGRFDNVINSGGVKLFPEQIESKLKDHLDKRFFIASEPHKILGNKIILIIESESNQLDISIFKYLEKFEKPKNVYAIKEFSETASGKIQRKKTLKKINL